MKIGIDISQLAYKNTGVANYLENLVFTMLEKDDKNEYVLFFSSLRGKLEQELVKELTSSRVKLKSFKFPPTFLDLMWNRLHVLPIESLIGEVDLFITSDWTEPPTKKAKKATILYDLVVYKHPRESDEKIVSTQKRKLRWVRKESDMVLCISEATRRDAKVILGLEDRKLQVVYPGV